MFNWSKRGIIFNATARFPWLQSHAQLPCSLHLYGSMYRIYFAGRDNAQRSHIAFIEIDLSNPSEIITLTEDPVLLPGPTGHFDEHGVYPSSVIRIGDKVYLYYIGWNKGFEAPLFYAGIGLAISEDGGKSFLRYSQAPVMDRSEYDPCLVTAPNVFPSADSKGYNMIYTSGLEWLRDDSGKLYSKYHLKMATSPDGINWLRKGRIVIGLKNDSERDISRSTLLFYEGVYHLWYAYNSDSHPYRIGYATSNDLENWERKDEEARIGTSTEWYEDEMVCYPHVIDHNGKLFMFYNGNRFGKDGLLLAVSTK